MTKTVQVKDQSVSEIEFLEGNWIVVIIFTFWSIFYKTLAEANLIEK